GGFPSVSGSGAETSESPGRTSAGVILPLVRIPGARGLFTPPQGIEQAQLLLRVSLSVIEHNRLPGGACKDAVPLCIAPSTVACTLRSTAYWVRVQMLPFLIADPLPVKVSPSQQNL